MGRESELDELERSLGSGENTGATIARAVGLQGMGGVGKTALAVALAHRLKHYYPDAQLVFNLDGVNPEPTKPEKIMEQVIQSFHPTARLPVGLDQLAGVYRAALSQAGKVLLLLDNAASAEQVEPLLPPANCLLLVTSRTHFRVPGLPCRSLDCLAPANSGALLLRHAPRLAGHEAEAAGLCGHLPLALEVFAMLVAERITYSVPELIGRLRRGTETLGEVDAAFTVSYELLPERTQRAWARASVFTASFDVRAAAAIILNQTDDSAVETARAELQTLVSASFVELHKPTGRYRLHDRARQFARTKLPAEEEAATRLRHAAFFCQVGALADELYLQGGENIVHGLALFDQERVHIEAAFGWLATQGGSEADRLLMRLVNAIGYTSDLRFHPRERIRWLEMQRLAAQRGGDARSEGNALGNLGNAYAALGEPRKAIDYHEQALAIDRKIGDRRGEGQDLGNLGLAYAALGEIRKALEYYEQRLKIALEIGDRRGEGNALGNLGAAYADLGEPRKAIEYYEHRLRIAREIGDRRSEGNALGNLGNACAVLGEPRKAIEYYEQHIRIAREIGDRRSEGNALGNLGNAYAALGEVHKAIAYYEQHLKVAQEIGDRRGEDAAHSNLGNAYASLGEPRKAVEYYEQHRKIAIEIGDRRSEGNALLSLGNAFTVMGDARKAIEHYEQALGIAREIGDQRAERVALGGLGFSYSYLNESRKSIWVYEQALSIAQHLGESEGIGSTLYNLAVEYNKIGEYAAAIALGKQSAANYDLLDNSRAKQIRDVVDGWLIEYNSDVTRRLGDGKTARN